MPDKTKWIWDDYRQARSTFLNSAQSKGAATISMELPHHLGADGQPLFMDGALIGPANAERVIVCLSGVHGIEGPAGSAVQAEWLKRADVLSTSTAVAMIHAVNPYGYSHFSRSTEDNVDLNRSFVDRSMPLPANDGYEKAHQFLCPEQVTDTTITSLQDFLIGFEREFGADYANSAVGSGQYTHPDGLYFGGQTEPWSANALGNLLTSFVSKNAREVAVIDFHTGRGDFAQPFFLCFDEPGSEGFAAASSWWGEDNLLQKDELGEKYNTQHPPPRSGLLFSGVKQILDHASVAGAVVEFGTYGLWDMYEAEMRDRWVRQHGKADDELTIKLRNQAFRAFTPNNSAWRDNVRRMGPAIIDAALILSK